jgi:cell division septal protein FtsQ
MKRLIGALIIVSIAVLAGRFAYYGLNELPWFHLNEVNIKDSDYLSHDEVLKASRLNVGESIFTQDIEIAAAELLELPGVEEIEINRQLPQSINIRLTTDRIALLAKTGKICGLTRTLKLIDNPDKDLILPIVTGLRESSRLSYNDRIRLRYALNIYDDLQINSNSLAERLSEIHFVSSREMELYFNPGGLRVSMPLRNYTQCLKRMTIMDARGLLGNTGFVDMMSGRIIARSGVM